jgi:hypothetical protein
MARNRDRSSHSSFQLFRSTNKNTYLRHDSEKVWPHGGSVPVALSPEGFQRPECDKHSEYWPDHTTFSKRVVGKYGSRGRHMAVPYRSCRRQRDSSVQNVTNNLSIGPIPQPSRKSCGRIIFTLRLTWRFKGKCETVQRFRMFSLLNLSNPDGKLTKLQLPVVCRPRRGKVSKPLKCTALIASTNLRHVAMVTAGPEANESIPGCHHPVRLRNKASEARAPTDNIVVGTNHGWEDTTGRAVADLCFRRVDTTTTLHWRSSNYCIFSKMLDLPPKHVQQIQQQER